MPRHKREIVAKLRPADVLVRRTVRCRRDPIDRRDGVSYYRWRREFGGLLEAEKPSSRCAVADLTLAKLILKEATWGNR